jgi:hypothetical protein
MRAFVASLIVLYFWDKDYNGGAILDGLDSMLRAISQSDAKPSRRLSRVRRGPVLIRMATCAEPLTPARSGESPRGGWPCEFQR